MRPAVSKARDLPRAINQNTVVISKITKAFLKPRIKHRISERICRFDVATITSPAPRPDLQQPETSGPKIHNFQGITYPHLPLAFLGSNAT